MREQMSDMVHEMRFCSEWELLFFFLHLFIEKIAVLSKYYRV